MKNLNELSKEVHQANAKWWQDVNTGEPIERNKGELLALAIGEVAEALEGERKNRMDDHLPHRKNAEVEMADAYIRLLDYAGGFKIHIDDRRRTVLLTPKNKGAALFKIMSRITMCSDPIDAGLFIYLSLLSIREYCKSHGYDLEGAMREKMAYNATRIDHTHEARRIAGGKQF